MENKKNQMRYATEQEANLLVELVQENREVILDKRTDHTMITKKQEAWAHITMLYNTSGIGAPKSCRQLKRMWEHQKSKAKKKHAADRKERMKTGGGSPSKDLDDTTNSQILSMSDKELESLDNIYDSDASQGSSTVKTSLTDDKFGRPISSEVVYLERSNTFPAYSAPVREYFMPPIRPSTPTSPALISAANIKHFSPALSSAAQPDDSDTPPPISRSQPQKRRKCSSEFYQEQCYEETMQLKNKEQKLDIEIKEKEILCYNLELELKALNKQILQLALANTKIEHETLLKKRDYYAQKTLLLSTWIETGQVWKEAGLAVKNAADAVSDKAQRI